MQKTQKSHGCPTSPVPMVWTCFSQGSLGNRAQGKDDEGTREGRRSDAGRDVRGAQGVPLSPLPLQEELG